MQDDISLAAGGWHDVYAVSGFAPGTPLLIYNKGNSTQTYWEGAQPLSTSWSGVPIPVNDAAIVTQAGVSGCWIRSGAPLVINVQQATGI